MRLNSTEPFEAHKMIVSGLKALHFCLLATKTCNYRKGLDLWKPCLVKFPQQTRWYCVALHVVTVSHILAVSYHSVAKVIRCDKWQHGKSVWVVSFGI